MQVISLSSLIKVGDEEGLTTLLSSFCCHKNPDVQSFLHRKAIENEKRSLSRTSLVVDEENNSEIIGYFTLTIRHFKLMDEISKSTRQKLTGSRDADIFSTILIAQLGRSDLYKGRAAGKEILGLALQNCKMIHDLSGLRVVCVEYDDVPYLNDFYVVNEFVYLGKNPDNDLNLKLHQAIASRTVHFDFVAQSRKSLLHLYTRPVVIHG